MDELDCVVDVEDVDDDEVCDSMTVGTVVVKVLLDTRNADISVVTRVEFTDDDVVDETEVVKEGVVLDDVIGVDVVELNKDSTRVVAVVLLGSNVVEVVELDSSLYSNDDAVECILEVTDNVELGNTLEFVKLDDDDVDVNDGEFDERVDKEFVSDVEFDNNDVDCLMSVDEVDRTVDRLFGIV